MNPDHGNSRRHRRLVPAYDWPFLALGRVLVQQPEQDAKHERQDGRRGGIVRPDDDGEGDGGHLVQHAHEGEGGGGDDASGPPAAVRDADAHDARRDEPEPSPVAHLRVAHGAKLARDEEEEDRGRDGEGVGVEHALPLCHLDLLRHPLPVRHLQRQEHPPDEEPDVADCPVDVYARVESNVEPREADDAREGERGSRGGKGTPHEGPLDDTHDDGEA